MKRRKTKEEKIRSEYRLKNFRIAALERSGVKDADEFGYLSREYSVKDLSKTLLYTTIILGLLLWVKMMIG